MKIDILTLPGSTTGVIPNDIETGVGGSELMLLQWARHMTRRGHVIRIYNNPHTPGVYEGVSFRNAGVFRNGDDRDVLISFRTPQPEETIPAKAVIRVGWSTDQFDQAYQRQWYAQVDGMVGISEYQRQDHMRRCSLTEAQNKMRVIEIGCEPEEFPVTEKTPYQFIYNSIPGRGLVHLAELWPLIRARYPEATLVVTSDFRLWTRGRYAGNEEYYELFRAMPGVRFLGCIPRSELLRHERESEIHLYPCTYEELFCISSAETQMAGCYGITSSVGALATTNFTGYRSPFDPGTQEFTDDVLREIDRWYVFPPEKRQEFHTEIRRVAHARFSWERICAEWEELFTEILRTKRNA